MSLVTKKMDDFFGAERSLQSFKSFFDFGIGYLKEDNECDRLILIDALVGVLIDMNYNQLISAQKSRDYKNTIMETIRPNEQMREGFQEFIDRMIPN